MKRSSSSAAYARLLDDGSAATRHRRTTTRGLAPCPFCRCCAQGSEPWTLRFHAPETERPRRPIPTHLKVSELLEILPCAGMDAVYARVRRGRIDLFWGYFPKARRIAVQIADKVARRA